VAEDSAQHTNVLEALAHLHFGKLSEAELRLLGAAPEGKTAWCGPKFVPGSPDYDPAKADQWGSEREIRAGLIAWLCIRAEAVKEIDPAGIQVVGAKILGRLNLFFAAIGFPLLFQRCRFYDDIDLKFVTVPALNLSGSFIGCLIADGIHVRGDVSLDHGLTSSGELRVLDAQIGGSLSCRSATLKNSGIALAADRAEIAGSINLDDGFSAEGEVRLPSTRIGCQLTCNLGAFKSLDLQGAVISDSLVWRDVQYPAEARLDLTNASVNAILDDEASWPTDGGLFLDGFVYRRFVNSPLGARERLRWLARQGDFRPQPYLQLARVLRDSADDQGARTVLIEMEDRRRRAQNRAWRQRCWDWVLRETIRYGQMPERALVWLALLVVGGGVLTGVSYLGGMVVPTDKKAYEVFEERGYPPDYYPAFNPFVYSFEHSFPLVSLNVKEHWEPAPTANVRAPHVQWRVSQILSELTVQDYYLFRMRAAWPLRWWLWLQVPLGWGLATLFVAGLTGWVKSDR
jgi:hypothetical protein